MDFENIKRILDDSADTISVIDKKIGELEIFIKEIEDSKTDIKNYIRVLKNRKNTLRKRVNFYKNKFNLKSSRNVSVVNQRPIDPIEKQVIESISGKYGIAFENITSNKRDKNLQVCRKEIYKELYEKYGRGFERIGFLFNRNHCSIMYMYYGKHKKNLDTC